MATVTVVVSDRSGGTEEYEWEDATHSIEPAITSAGRNEGETVVRVYRDRSLTEGRSVLMAVIPLREVVAIEVDR